MDNLSYKKNVAAVATYLINLFMCKFSHVLWWQSQCPTVCVVYLMFTILMKMLSDHTQLLFYFIFFCSHFYFATQLQTIKS